MRSKNRQLCPRGVGGEQALPAGLVEGPSEGPPAYDDGSEPRASVSIWIAESNALATMTS